MLPEKVLILGDGNFSFSLAVARDRSFLSKECTRCRNQSAPPSALDGCTPETQISLYATSYDCEQAIKSNQASQRNVIALKGIPDVYVLHQVDATNIGTTFPEEAKFLKVIFNFPHVGGKSNIKACRNLLVGFFSSVKDFVDDDDGRVYVTLCRGQGGTPVDAGRKGYGNSWQIANQAAKAGFVLSNVVPFESIAPSGYEPAGYRGSLQKGFIKKDSLTHIFKKVQRISIPETLKFASGKTLVSAADDFYLNKLTTLDPLASTWHPFSLCLSYINLIFSETYGIPPAKVTSIGSNEGGGNVIRQCSGNTDILQKWIDESSNSTVDIHSHMIIDLTTDILPYSYPIKPEVVLTDSSSTFESLNDFATNLQSFWQKIFKSCLITLSWDESANKATVNNSAHRFNVDDGEEGFDIGKIPHFLADINMDLWLTSKPEVTISHTQSSDQLSYLQLDYDKYTMTERERNYFCRSKKGSLSFCHCFDDSAPVCNVKLNNVVVASISRADHQFSIINDSDNRARKEPPILLIIRPDLMAMALLRINDIRLFWLEDAPFMTNLKDCMVNEITPLPKVLYPLCYRHDICFWVKEMDSEETFVSAIRYCCKDMVHSVRLLRILRHEETGLLSFCYRIIYSRCDGPLSHKESVAIQNILRLLLIDLKFALR